MTVQTNTNVASFSGNGVTQIFPIAFKFNNDTDLVVLRIDDATGSATLLTLNSDYTVSGEGEEDGGLINVVVAPSAGQRLKVSRIVDILQLIDLRNQGKFFAEVHEAAFDLLTMIAQQHETALRQSIRVAEYDEEPARLPGALSRANQLMAFDSNGNPTTALPVSGTATDLALNLQNSADSAKGAAMVGYKARSVYERLSDRKSIADNSPSGDGVADDLAAVNAAIAESPDGKVLLGPATYRVSATPTNPYGVEFDGKGVIGLPVTGGLRQLNTYADKHKIVIGKEYLFRAYQRLALGQSSSTGTLRVFVYGDSTVAGGNGESAPYQVQNLIGQLALMRGLGNIVVTNRGVGGTMVNSLNVLPDLSATTDLVVIKYGINDGGNPEATRLSTFATTLRSKLAEIRAAANGGIGAVSILLVGPNSTSDTPNGRDERWYEQLRGVYVQAARDYQCAYFDTYAYLKDSRGAAGLWMDNPYSDGRAIHPLDAMQAWIWGGVWDAFFGAGETALMRSNTLANTGAVNGSANVSTLPNDYGYGISIQRATAAAGWPEDGAVITTSQVDGVRIQQLVPYTAGRTRMIMRTADTASNAWNRWTGVVESLTTQNGWVDYGSPGDLAPLGCYLSADGTVYVQGGVKSGTTASGTTVATLPAGMLPAAPAYFPCYTGGTTAWVSVNSDGTIRLAGAGNASLMALNGISFRAA